MVSDTQSTQSDNNGRLIAADLYPSAPKVRYRTFVHVGSFCTAIGRKCNPTNADGLFGTHRS